MTDVVFARGYYLAVFLLLGIGAYIMMADRNLVKKIIGMNVFQTGIFLFFVVAGFVDGASPPLVSAPEPRVSPLPHVIILTAIVVGVSLTAVALGLVVRIYGEYGTLDTSAIREMRADE